MSDIDLDALWALAKAAADMPYPDDRNEHASPGPVWQAWFAALLEFTEALKPDVVTQLVAQAREAGRLREALERLWDLNHSYHGDTVKGLCEYGSCGWVRAALAQPVPPDTISDRDGLRSSSMTQAEPEVSDG